VAKKSSGNAKTVAAVAVGGIIVLGAAAFAFGDVAGSLGNLPIGGIADGTFIIMIACLLLTH
jgi:hypothetical protein